MPTAKERAKALRETLAAEQATVNPEQQRDALTRIAPLERSTEQSFIQRDSYAVEDQALIQPDLTNTSMAEVESIFVDNSKMEVDFTTDKKGAETRREQIIPTPENLERLTDEQIKSSGILKGGSDGVIHPARQSYSSERPRNPGAKAPAAGPGSWPEPEDRLPAALPSDPPVEEREEATGPGDKTFAGVSGFTLSDSGLDVKSTRAGTTLRIPRKRVTEAAAVYMRLRQQHPGMTTDQLKDEFIIQFEGGIGSAQSHRPADEMSPHGLTAVGDDRVLHEGPKLGKERESAPVADPAPTPPAPAGTPDSGAPSANEPSTTAPDDSKETSGSAAETDQKAADDFAKFDRDGDGRPGGSKSKTDSK